MNKQIMEKIGISEQDYFQYCRKYNKPSYLRSTKTEFFKKIQDGLIIRDKKGNLLEKK